MFTRALAVDEVPREIRGVLVSVSHGKRGSVGSRATLAPRQ